MARHEHWRRGPTLAVAALLLFFSAVVFGLAGADLGLILQYLALSNYYYVSIGPYLAPSITAIAFALITGVCSLAVLIAVGVRRANGVGVGVLAVLLSLGWLAIMAYQAYVLSNVDPSLSYFLGCKFRDNTSDYFSGPNAGSFSSGSSGYGYGYYDYDQSAIEDIICSDTRVNFSWFIMTIICFILCVALAFLAFLSAVTEKRTKRQGNGFVPQGQENPHMSYVPAPQGQQYAYTEPYSYTTPASPQPGQTYLHQGQQYMFVPVQQAPGQQDSRLQGPPPIQSPPPPGASQAPPWTYRET